jgi:hypothetical protein
VGPEPILFSPEPAATKASISADSARPLADLAKILRTLAAFEHVGSIDGARDVVNNPREGSTTTFPFKKPRGGKKSILTPKKQNTGSS